MTDPNFLILYVDSLAASAGFYTTLLGRPPIESGPTFAMFAPESGMRLGLWAKHTVEPAAAATGGGAELVFSVDNEQAVNEMHAQWSTRGLAMLQMPVQMDFGYTFVALDPDGHRLRVHARNGA